MTGTPLGGETTGADTGFNTNLGVASPGSPGDEMGTTAMPSSGAVGAADPGEDSSLSGDDQVHDLGMVDEGTTPATQALRPRLVEDIDPGRSNVSGPTETEERSGS